jgi:hypothetical protein
MRKARDCALFGFYVPIARVEVGFAIGSRVSGFGLPSAFGDSAFGF